MRPYLINEQMLGTDTTADDAYRMIDLLAEEGYDVEYGQGINEDKDYISDGDWVHALATIAYEHRQRTVYLPDEIRHDLEWMMQKWWETFGNSDMRDRVVAWLKNTREQHA